MKSNFQQLAAEWADLDEQIEELERKRDEVAAPLNEAAERVLAAKRTVSYWATVRFCGMIDEDVFDFELWEDDENELLGSAALELEELAANEEAQERMGLEARRADLAQRHQAVAEQAAYYTRKLDELDDEIAALEEPS